MFAKLAEKINKKLRDTEEEEIEFKQYDEESKATTVSVTPEQTSKSGPAISSDGNLELKIAHPQSYQEVSDIADFLLDGCTVVLNLENMEKSECLRMLDFLNGVTYTTGGDIKPIAQNSYIITPNNVDVAGQM